MRITSDFSSYEIRKTIESRWQEYLSKYGNLFTSDSLSGSSPPSVFVGSYGYPKVGVGPMVPPIHGNTTLLDNPEKWLGKSLEDIVNFRLSLVRGIQKMSVQNNIISLQSQQNLVILTAQLTQLHLTFFDNL